MRAVRPHFIVLSESHETQAVKEIEIVDSGHYHLLSDLSRTGGAYYILESIDR